MNKWQVIGLLLCVLTYVISKLDVNISAVPETQKVVSGILAELSEVNLDFGWQYDKARRDALNAAREVEERGTFTPPSWMSEKLSGLSISSSIEDIRSVYRSISERLWEPQNGPEFARGRDYVRQVIYPDESNSDVCEDCDGTGKVGDGRIFTECLNCGGDGKIDESDRKEDVAVVETPTPESAGDQVSRRPTSVSVGSSGSSTSNRVRFPRINRLFGR